MQRTGRIALAFAGGIAIAATTVAGQDAGQSSSQRPTATQKDFAPSTDKVLVIKLDDAKAYVGAGAEQRLVDTAEIPIFLDLLPEDGQVQFRDDTPRPASGAAAFTLNLRIRVPRSDKAREDPPNNRTWSYTVKELRDLAVDKRIDVVVVEHSNTAGVADQSVNVITFSTDKSRVLKVLETKSTNHHQVVDVPLDRTGVVDWRFLNPRDPRYVPSRANGQDVSLRFRNRLSDRILVVSFSGIPSDKRAALVDAGLPVTCSSGKCQASLHVGPSGSSELPIGVLQQAFASDPNKTVAPVAFNVSLFDDTSELANPRGYVSLVPGDRLAETASATEWGVSMTADAAEDLDLSGLVPPCPAGQTDCSKDPVINVATPRSGTTRGHVTGTVRATLRQKLGDRANGEVELQIKKNDLGGDEAVPTVRASKYRLNIFAANGASFSGGRYLFAAPSQSIAVFESGEGVSAAFRGLELSHLFKKEVPNDRIRRELLGLSPGSDGIENGDHSTTILQLKDRLKTPQAHLVVNLLLLRGVEDLKGLHHWYWTAGTDALYSIPHTHVQGTVGWYRSRRHGGGGEPERQEGTVWLGTVNWTNFNHDTESGKQKVDYALSVLVGRGSGDKADTDKREDFIGQSAKFAPDLIFLSTLAPFIQPEPGLGRVGKGLANKWYTGTVFNHQQFSPLAYLAKLVHSPGVISKGTTVAWHRYSFNEAVFGSKAAGSELDAEFRVEAPRGITYKLSYGLFSSGDALKSVVLKKQQLALLTISATL